MKMTEEQQLESLKQEMAKLDQLEAEYLRKKDIEEFGVSTTQPLEIPAIQRLTVKNLGVSPEQSVEYLKQQNPDMDFIVQDGEIFGKKVGEKTAYKALDPSFSPLSAPIATLQDIPADIGDIAYDVPAGIVQGGAATLGAVPGVFTLNPPLAVGGAAAGSAISGAALETLRQGLGRMLGVSKEMSPEQIALAGAIGGAIPVAGVAAARGITAAAPAAKQAVGRMMGLTKEEAKQMAKNPEMFYSLKDVFLGKGSPVQAQKIARDSLKTLVEDLKSVGLSENEALRSAITGMNVDVDMKTLRSTLGKITDPRARAKAARLLNEARKYQIAQRPFQPEFATREARQMGVQGLERDNKIIPSEAKVTEEVPEQMSFFTPETVMKPEYKGIPQPPKAPSATLLEAEKLVAPTEEDLINYYKWKEAYDAMAARAKNPRTYRYLKDIKDKPVPPQEELLQTKIVTKTPEEEMADLAEFLRAEEAIKQYEARFPQLKQAQAPELMLPPTPSTVKVPAVLPPASSEYFAPEVTSFSEMLQQPLEMATRKGIPANLAREFRQLLQSEAKYSAMGTPSKRIFADLANELNVPLRQIKGLEQAEAAMGAGKELQKKIRAMALSKRPIKALATPAEDFDIRALMEEAAQRVSTLPPKQGKMSFKDIKAATDAARKAAELEKEKGMFTTAEVLRGAMGGLAGHQYGGTKGAILGGAAGLATSPKTASYALPVISGFEAATPALQSKYAYPLWLQMLQLQNKGEQK